MWFIVHRTIIQDKEEIKYDQWILFEEHKYHWIRLWKWAEQYTMNIVIRCFQTCYANMEIAFDLEPNSAIFRIYYHQCSFCMNVCAIFFIVFWGAPLLHVRKTEYVTIHLCNKEILIQYWVIFFPVNYTFNSINCQSQFINYCHEIAVN